MRCLNLKNLVIFSAIFCLMVAALYSYIANNNIIFNIFAGFDCIILLGVYFISKWTEKPKENYDMYHSAHSL